MAQVRACAACPQPAARAWPAARDNHVTEPTPPDDANIDPNTHDVTGNVSCSTGTDTADAPEQEHSFLAGGEDSCDQVGLIIPAASSEPTLGSIGGTVWRDLNRDGLRGDGSRRWRESTCTCWTPPASVCPDTRP